MGLKLMDREAGSRATWPSARLSARPWGEERTRRNRLGAATVAAAVAARFSICSSKHHIKHAVGLWLQLPLPDLSHAAPAPAPLHADLSTYGAADTGVLAAEYATACRELECCQLTIILIKVSLQIIAILRPSSSTPACLLLRMH